MPKNGHSRSYVLKEGGRLDLCDIPLSTIGKLYKHIICEINNEISVSLTSGLGLMYTNAFTVSREKVLSITTFSKLTLILGFCAPENGNNGLIPKNYYSIE